MTDAESFANIYDQIDQLNHKEKELRAEIAQVRRERTRLKAQCNLSYISGRPQWIEKLPQEAWFPSFYANKILSDLNPNVEHKNVPPDLIDWARTGGVKEFLVNLGITVAVVVLGLQLIFLIF